MKVCLLRGMTRDRVEILSPRVRGLAPKSSSICFIARIASCTAGSELVKQLINRNR